MTQEELNQALYDKADAEMKKFTDWLLTQPPEEILRHAYVYSVKQDILLGLDSADLTKEQANALLQSPTPLEDIYKALDKWDVNMMADIQECIEGRADAVIAEMRLQYDVPLYLHPASYAQEHFELEQYRASNKANAACKEAIEAAIREHYHDNRLDSQAAEQVISTFGLERTLYVLANTVQQKNWDKRFSPGNRQWAETISITKNPDAWGNDQNSQFVVDSHSGLTDLFLRTVRREYCQEQEKSPKQSVRAKLQTQPFTTSPKRSAKLKEPER